MPKNQPQAPLDHLNCLSTKLATCLWLYPVVPQPSDELPVQWNLWKFQKKPIPHELPKSGRNFSPSKIRFFFPSADVFFFQTCFKNVVNSSSGQKVSRSTSLVVSEPRTVTAFLKALSDSSAGRMFETWGKNLTYLDMDMHQCIMNMAYMREDMINYILWYLWQSWYW